MTVKGVDVSSYQSERFSTKGLHFAIIKVTEGTSYTNPKWVAQRATARSAGLVTGFYHFVRPGVMADQADYFLSKIKLVKGDILVLDWEDPGVSASQKDIWIKYVQQKAPGHKVLLYCNRDYWINRDKTSFAGDGLWIAEYGVPAGKPRIQAPWVFHQYTDDPIDTNVGAFKDLAALRAWAGVSASKPPAPKPTTPPKETKVALTKADVDKVVTGTWKSDGMVDAPWSPENPTRSAGSTLADLAVRVREIQNQLGVLENLIREQGSRQG